MHNLLTSGALKILVVGLGLSGRSAVRFLLKRGHHVTGMDRSQALLNDDQKVATLRNQGMLAVHESEMIDVQNFDLIVVSPGVPHTHPYYKNALAHGIEVIGEVELACRFIKKVCLGVTGTNGKTTVTLLIAHVLNSAGIKAKALGNIGIPLTEALDDCQHEDLQVYVLELSSFQLETLRYPCLDAGIILNITPDHLDRYAGMEEYAQSKVALKNALKPEGVLFVEERCFETFQHLFKDTNPNLYGFGKENLIYSDAKSVFMSKKQAFALPQELVGIYSHDIENIMAAFAICATQGVSGEQFVQGLGSFQKPPHRIQFVTTKQGIRFYDDSKGTNIDAVIRAVNSFNGNILLIAGGVDKGFPYSPWIKAFNGKVKSIFALGQSASKIQADLQSHIPVEICADLDKAVRQAATLAKEGDIVLLSPGCSSFDMFKDYTQRGKEFQRIVNAL